MQSQYEEFKEFEMKYALSGNRSFNALIVDDYRPSQQLLGASLSAIPEVGEIEYAENGEVALQKAKTKKYDLVFLDVMMPGLDGYETCKLLRENPDYKRTPIIMVTGRTSPIDEVKGIVSGCTTYVTKPVHNETFRKLSQRMFSWIEEYLPTYS
jgi:CheY-like chemotaxis protein